MASKPRVPRRASRPISPASTSKAKVSTRFLFDTEMNYFYGGLFLPVRLMVLDEDLAQAQRLLAEKES